MKNTAAITKKQTVLRAIAIANETRQTRLVRKVDGTWTITEVPMDTFERRALANEYVIVIEPSFPRPTFAK